MFKLGGKSMARRGGWWLAIACVLAGHHAAAATPILATSYNTSTALHSSGAVLIWGITPSSIVSAPAVLAGAQSIESVAQGSGFVVVAKGGSVWTAGLNDTGQLGDGTNQFRPSLVQVPGLADVKKVFSGQNSAYALHADGSVSAWGANAYGQLGDGTTIDRSHPAKIPGLTNITSIAASGWGHVLALRADGTVWAWGQNGTGNLGDGTLTSRTSPVQVVGLTGVAAISTGGGHSLALKSDGTVWGWGWNAYGQLSTSAETALVPVQASGISGVTAVSGGNNNTFALKSDGTVWAWGANVGGALGTGDSTHSQIGVPTRVAGLPAIAAIASGPDHTIAMAQDGSVYAWGSNAFGQLGDGSFTDRPTPVRVLGPGGRDFLNLISPLPATINLAPVVSMTVLPGSGTAPLRVTLDAGPSTDPDGSIVDFQWTASTGETASGRTSSMVLGSAGTVSIKLVATDNNGARSLEEASVLVLAAPSAPTVPKVSASSTHTLALKSDGTVWAWGVSAYLGRFVAAPREPKPLFTGLSGVRSITGGWWNHSFAVNSDGTVWGWGFDSSGELGDGGSAAFSNPVKASITNVIAAGAGDKFSVFLKSDGTVWAAGYNADGRLGDGTRIDRNTPVQVVGLSNIAAISVGRWHALALARDGRLWAWGLNEAGEVGDGTTVARTVPVQLGIQNVRKISAGSNHSLAVTADGNVWSWGSNWTGQLGDGTRNDHAVPVLVPTATGIAEVSGGGSHSLALTNGGDVLAWGGNCFPTSQSCEGSGQIGDGTLDMRLRPVRVAGLDKVTGISAGFTSSMAYRFDGTVWMWGRNSDGQLGDGTFANRLVPQLVLDSEASGFFDVLPEVANAIPPAKIPVFPVLASDSSSDTVRNVEANVQFRASDVGATGSLFVFAWAPAGSVKDAMADNGAKDAPVPCVLAQLSSSGQLTAVSSGNLQAYVTGVLSAQGQTVSVLNSVPTTNIAGATFYVGYGSSATSMINNGTNRSVASVPGQAGCQPQAPKTGWWWNPQEGGRGYSIEAQGNHIFFAAFHYDVSGRSTWNVASGPTSIDGSLFTGDLLGVHGGQTLGGPYNGFPQTSTAGSITLAFSDASHGTMIWPGGVVPIERMNLVPDGLDAAQKSDQPENGWWWNPQEAGRGFFIEWQGDWADLAGYMYDDSGNPVWYISVYETPNTRQFSGSWWSYANGQSMGGVFKPATQTSDHVAPVTVQFNSPDTAIMTLPNGRTTSLVRQRF
jgi:alpha-tubulin suppressor-like RCC1 family protein